jgi:SOS response regulatory protein OraA/RecX
MGIKQKELSRSEINEILKEKIIDINEMDVDKIIEYLNEEGTIHD